MVAHAPLRQGDIILVPFPFADLAGIKLRPAVVISADPQHSELILACITSVTTNRSPRRADLELLRGDAEFAGTGLKVNSLVRFDKLVTVSRTLISRRLAPSDEPLERWRRPSCVWLSDCEERTPRAAIAETRSTRQVGDLPHLAGRRPAPPARSETCTTLQVGDLPHLTARTCTRCCAP